MPPDERSRQLVYELDAWYRAHTMRQKDLASALGLSPQGLNEILALRNRPTGTQVLAILEFLRKNTMTTDRPNTLSKALDQLDALSEELAQLKKAGKATTLPPGTTAQIPPVVTVTQPSAPKPPAPLPAALPSVTNDRGTELIFNPAPPLAELSDIDKLRVQLNAEKDSTKRNAIYLKIKQLEREQRGPQRVS